jgi:DNA-binding response OmpR family regulator
MNEILSVGYETRLLETRSMILRYAGYTVQEVTVLATALYKMNSEEIALMLVCNSIPRREQEWLANETMNKRRLMPILCVQRHPYESCIPGCTSVDGEPVALLAAIARLMRRY